MNAKKNSNWFDRLPKGVQTVIYIVGGILGILAAYRIWGLVSKLLNNIQHDISDETVTYEDGSVDTINYATIATSIHDAFYNAGSAYWEWGLSSGEDEDSAIAALLMVPKDKIQKLANKYTLMFNENLYNDFKEFVEDDYYKVSHLLD